VQRAQELAGVEPPISFGLIIGCLFGGIVVQVSWLAMPLLIQEGLNKIWGGLPRDDA